MEEPRDDFISDDNFEPGDLLIALEGEDIFLVPRGRDVFKSPQGCSGTHPVGKDETSRPVGGALFFSAAEPQQNALCRHEQKRARLINWDR